MWYFWLSLITPVIITLLIYFNRKLPNLPGPSIYEFIFDAIRYRSIIKLFRNYNKKYGDIYKVYFIGDVVITNPSDIKRILQSNTRGKKSVEKLSEVSGTRGL